MLSCRNRTLKSHTTGNYYYRCLVTKLCPTLRNPMDCSLPGSSVHRISHAKILKWVAIFFFRASSQPRDQTQVSCIACGFFKNFNKKPPPTNLHYIVFILKVQSGSHQAIIQVLAGLCSFWGSRREPVLASSSF